MPSPATNPRNSAVTLLRNVDSIAGVRIAEQCDYITRVGVGYMKGPHERRKYDLRRVWECPDCHHKERTFGSVTAAFCKCQKQKDRTDQRAMLLCEEGPRRVV